jgi:hypothetical protein
MKQKTAVEYLEESLINLEEQRDQLWSGLYLEWLKNFIEQAKRIEKEQIIQAYGIGSMKHLSKEQQHLDGENYFNNKYN